MEEVYAAIIGAIASFIGSMFVFFWYKKDIKIRLKEIELKEEGIERSQEEFQESLKIKQIEIDNVKEELNIQLENLKQNQLISVINKRLDAYPKLWEVFITYGLHWEYEKKEYNYEWARNYIDELRDCNKKYGVFFSQDVYNSFYELRIGLMRVLEKFENNEKVDIKECSSLYNIITIGTPNSKALSVVMKDDLGSYGNSIIQMRPKKTY